MTSQTSAVEASESAKLRLGDSELATYHSGTVMPPGLSPRPYLHPVVTRAGSVVTAAEPADHLHHYGMSLAVPDVDGTSYWGGSTYVRGTGSTILANHGRQHRLAFLAGGENTLTEQLEWRDPAGCPQLREVRTISWSTVDDSTWALDWQSVLHAGPAPVTFGSPATNGKPGGFYGGLFWRTPFTSEDVSAVVADGVGESVAHGSVSPWLALTTSTRSIVLLQRGEVLPWFVRTASYAGAGPALAVHERRTVTPGIPLVLRLTVAITDRSALSVADAAAIAAQL